MFECPYCNRPMSSQARLDYHLTFMVCHKPAKTCPKCGVTFASKQSC